ncbi:MAG TPA: hypothetical protein VGG44_09920 [Tepidisphaeraceae bacterium]|jgi:hypothetical protein
MLKSTMVKWAVAALLAVPAVPLFARHTHRKPLVTRSHHTALVSGKRSHRTLTSKHHRSTLLGAKSLKSHRSLTHRGIHKNTLSSASHFHVHFTKMPPTIDGIRS